VEKIVQMTQSPVESSGESILDTVKPSPILVLLVDDDACFLKASKQCLETQGHFQIDTASSVDEAMGKMKKAKYDVVVSDHQMPGKNGLQFLKELREKDNTVPFIIFTGRGREEVAIKALNLGADGYFNKIGQPETVYGELAHGIIQAAEKSKAENAFRDSETRYRLLFRQSPVGAALAIPEGSIVDCNEAMQMILGYSLEELKKINVVDLYVNPEERKPLIEKIKRKGIATGFTAKLKRKDGTAFDVELNVALVHIEGKEYFQTTLQDVSERKKAEERLRAILASSPDAIIISDLNGNIVDFNEATVGMTGYSTIDVVGKNGFEFIAEKDRERALEAVKKAFEHGTVRNIEYTLMKKDNEEFEGELSVGALKDSSGGLIGFVAILRDITERKNAEEKLRESEQRFRCLVENTLVGIATIDMKGRLTYLNRATADMFGYSGSEMLGQPFNSFLHPDDEGKIMRSLLELIPLRREPQLLEFRGVRNDGHVINLMSKPTRFVLDGKTVGFQAIILDVSESRKAGREHLMQKERAQEYLDIIGNIVVALDSNGRIVMLNKKGHEILGYEERKLLGKDWFETCVPKESREQAAEVFKACMQGKLDMAQHDENPVLAKNGGKRIVSWYTTVLKDDDGKIIGTLSSGEDITERKKAEESAEESKKKLDAVNEKLRAVGGLTRHDVRNKLSTVIGNVYLVKKKVEDNSEILENLEDIESGCNQIVKILDFSKAYEMLGVEELTYVNVEEAAQEAISLFSDLKAAKVRIECKGLSVLADSLLRQLFYNLIDNSLKHGKKVSQIRIHFEVEGDRLRLYCEDDGVGISPEAKKRIFQQGYTTGTGTGYGLYLIEKITEVYGWTIDETGKSGEGARFVITIPKTSAKEEENYRILTIETA
jgi:PAS domain S-box-containing protein